MSRDPFEISDEDADEFWEDLVQMFEDEPPQDQLRIEKGVAIQTEPVVGWRVWRVQTRANETYESQTMGSLATLIKLVVDNPIEEVLAQVAADVMLHPWGYSSGGTWPRYKPMVGGHPGAHRDDSFDGVCPVPGCGCGIWAFTTLERLREQFGGEAGAHVVGTVALWGKVIRTTYGFRAQYAYPQELEYICRTEPTDIDYGVAAAIQRAYGVPCVAMPPWRSPDFPRGLRGITASSASSGIFSPPRYDWMKAQEEMQQRMEQYPNTPEEAMMPCYVPSRKRLHWPSAQTVEDLAVACFITFVAGLIALCLVMMVLAIAGVVH